MSSSTAAAAAASTQPSTSRDITTSSYVAHSVRPVIVVVIVDVFTARACPWLWRSAGNRRRPAAKGQRRPNRGFRAGRRGHSHHRHSYSADAGTGRRTNWTTYVCGTLTSSNRNAIHCHQECLAYSCRDFFFFFLHTSVDRNDLIRLPAEYCFIMIFLLGA